jgi:hypothetical protein
MFAIELLLLRFRLFASFLKAGIFQSEKKKKRGLLLGYSTVKTSV